MYKREKIGMKRREINHTKWGTALAKKLVWKSSSSGNERSWVGATSWPQPSLKGNSNPSPAFISLSLRLSPSWNFERAGTMKEIEEGKHDSYTCLSRWCRRERFQIQSTASWIDQMRHPSTEQPEAAHQHRIHATKCMPHPSCNYVRDSGEHTLV